MGSPSEGGRRPLSAGRARPRRVQLSEKEQLKADAWGRLAPAVITTPYARDRMVPIGTGTGARLECGALAACEDEAMWQATAAMRRSAQGRQDKTHEGGIPPVGRAVRSPRVTSSPSSPRSPCNRQ